MANKNKDLFLARFGDAKHLLELNKSRESHDRFLRSTVAKNPAAPKSVIDSSLNDTHPYVRDSALENPNIEIKHLNKAMTTGDEDSAIAVMKNPNATTKHISSALKPKYSNKVHRIASIHPNTNDDHIKVCLNHDDSSVRLKCVQENPNLSKETLDRVGLHDPDGDVCEAAIARSKKINNKETE